MLSYRRSGFTAACLAMVGMLACGSDEPPEEHVGTAVSAIVAGPVGTASGFEDDDGNLAPGPAPDGFDWNSFATTTWTGSAPNRATTKSTAGWDFAGFEDRQASNSDNSFAGGVKQDNNCASVGTGKPPNKDDLERAYFATKTVNGNVFLNLAWVRIPQNTTSPSAHIGFEFNKATSGACPAGSGGLVQRTAGDMLIVYDFEGGATNTPTITLRRWVTSGPCEVGSSSAPCWGPATNLTALGFAEARVNTSGAVTDGISPSPPDNLGTNEFGEAGINLTAAGVFQPGVCEGFGKAYAVSRSSGNSATAAMKDLVGPGDFRIANCGEINIIKRTNPRGLNQNFGFTSTIPGNTSFSLNDVGNTTSDSAGNTKSITQVQAGTYTVTEGADPAGFQFTSVSCTGTGGSTGTQDPATPKEVDINLTAGGSVTCIYVNSQQRGALKIIKNSIKAGVPSLPGASFTITTPAGSSIPVTTGPDGTACVDNLDFGTYNVTETGAPSGYAIDNPNAQPVVVSANGTCASGAATVTFTDTPLTNIECKATSQAVNGTKSKITCRDASGTVIASSGAAFIDPATAAANGLMPGTYTCIIEVDP
ncbi:MSCRAMM family protein [Polyangium jinanense]|uniref:Prealbumin-like fold domain-containing protein n=1 Tax=Polyangium jinanense TaxID=2829994 RepID=A0A9X4AX10_9BACT|nr:prealbumin-like fold domain-containing protein [Polyangium jinanense]MDC3960787.1 hypothetical protein [Polyangium jinanense]MDC3985835.1 hypothetical protein [Polyangium jinanense]